jgi:hypothetical protein
MEHHAVLGNAVGADGRTRIYTRTVVLWAVGINIDTDLLWQHVTVAENAVQTVSLTDRVSLERTPSKRKRGDETAASHLRPVVLMMSTAELRRGNLAKRMKSQQTFRSVLSMDIEYRGSQPNLKISGRNTIQMTALGGTHHPPTDRYAGYVGTAKRSVARTSPPSGTS